MARGEKSLPLWFYCIFFFRFGTGDLLSGLISKPSSESAIRRSSRLWRVSSCLVLTTPEGCRAPVPGRLDLEEVPGLAPGAEVALFFAAEMGLVALFVRVLARLVFGSFKRFDAGWAHPARAGKLLHLCYVHGAPLAFGLTRGQANGIGAGVDALPHAIDPPEAQPLVHRLGVGDAGFAGRLFVETNPEFLAWLVRGFEPALKRLGGSKKDDLYRPDSS